MINFHIPKFVKSGIPSRCTELISNYAAYTFSSEYVLCPACQYKVQIVKRSHKSFKFYYDFLCKMRDTLICFEHDEFDISELTTLFFPHFFFACSTQIYASSFRIAFALDSLKNNLIFGSSSKNILT